MPEGISLGMGCWFLGQSDNKDDNDKSKPALIYKHIEVEWHLYMSVNNENTW